MERPSENDAGPNGSVATRDLLPPCVIVRLEGLTVVVLSIFAYYRLDGATSLLLSLILAPDIFMSGYVLGASMGARIYNIGHTYILPALLGAAGWAGGDMLWLHIALIWSAHIGIDRLFGFGLKRESGFRDMHPS